MCVVLLYTIFCIIVRRVPQAVTACSTRRRLRNAHQEAIVLQALVMIRSICVLTALTVTVRVLLMSVNVHSALQVGIAGLPVSLRLLPNVAKATSVEAVAR